MKEQYNKHRSTAKSLPKKHHAEADGLLPIDGN